MAKSKSTSFAGAEGEVVRQFNGLSPEQLEMIFEEIATSATVLVEFAAEAAQRVDESSQNDFHVVKYMAERLGALAELPVDECARGSFEGWTLGPRYVDGTRTEVSTEQGA